MTRAGTSVAQWCARAPDRAVAVFLAVAAYVPMLLTEPGRVSADTKTYLTVDPGAVLAQATSMWDPSVGAGSVPHQNIGYLFPLGPYYWVMEQLAVPDWLTQRLLWGTLVFAAAYGAHRLARWLGWSAGGALVVGFAYGFSPYLLSYLARLSVILGPWAALPWMILLAAKAARTRSWRPAAQFAVVVALVGSVNATALVLAGLGPVIWLLTDVLSGRVRWTAAAAGAARIGVLSLVVSVWWIVALRVQGTWGIPILRYTETYESVASASTPAEVMRGLGYWFFYGGDRLDAWVGPSLPYTDHPVVMAVGFTLAGLALLGFLVPFVGRVSATVLLVIGLAVSVGAAPLGSPSPYGALFEWFASDTTVGLALRSTPRAAPLVILALAFGLGATSEWLRARAAEQRPASTSFRYAAPAGMIVLLAVQLFPWFTGNALTPSLLRDEDLPDHVTELADWLDGNATADGRVWELPASDFANYRWGGTVDPVLPGLIDRPYLARELVPQGGAGTADLLNAVERRIPEGWFEPETLPAVADRFGVDTIVVRNDLEHERYRLARPGPLWADVTGVLGEPDFAGPVVTDDPEIPVLDERTLARPDAADAFPVVAAFDLPSTTAAVTTATATAPIVLAGSGEGIVDLAGAGLLDPQRPVLYAGTLADAVDAGSFDPAMVGSDTWWVVSDTNRRQGRHWSTVSANLGALEAAGPLQLDDDPGDNRLDLFEGEGDDELARQTIGVHVGDVADVRSSYYGYRVAYTPEDAPWFAVDGDPSTAWRAGIFDEVEGLVWEVDLREPAPVTTIELLQPITGATNRFVTRARITLDDAVSFDVDLDERSRSLPGQTVEFPADLGVESYTSLRIEVLADNVGTISSYVGQPGIGLAEVRIPGVRDDRVVRVPSLDAFDGVVPESFDDQRVSLLFTRQRLDPATSNQFSAEPFLVRSFEVPDTRSFDVSGEARLAADASEELLLEVLDDPADVVADRRIRGNPDARGASAVDGDPTTAWRTPFDGAEGATLTIGHPEPVDVDSITVTWLDDGRHSPPSELTLTGDDGRVHTLDVPAVPAVDGRASATFDVPGHSSSRSVVTVVAVDARTTPEYFSGVPQVLPVGIAEVQFGDDPDASFDRTLPLDDRCRDDVLELDGEPFPVRLIGSRDDALTRGELTLQACTSTELVSGRHRLDAAPGSVSGFDVDRLLVDGDPAPGVEPPVSSPGVSVTDVADTRLAAVVGPSATPSWLILEQSWNEGWTATAGGEDLGAPVLIDGYANGWLLPAAADERTVELRWTPQRAVTLALWFSLVAGIGVLGIAVFGRHHGAEPIVARRRSSRLGDPRLARLAVPAGVAVTFAVLAGPIPAVVGLVAAAVGARVRWLAPAVVLVAGAVAAGAIIALEWRFDYPPGPDWPDRFGWTAPLVWSAVAAVAATSVREAVGPHEGRG